jgi:putative SOS response-associated peptidase YedK
VCANYLPVTDGDKLLAFFGVQRDFRAEAPAEAFPLRLAPFIRLVKGERAAAPGLFGLLPPWRREVQHGRTTYNARSETVATKASFKDSWRQGLRCVIPAEAVFEQRYYEDASHERWRIEKEDGTPFGIAGIYSEWIEGGETKFSFAMLTVNADAHPFYSQFHEPGEEKRMPVFLAAHEYDDWMACPLKEAPKYFKAWAGPFKAARDPIPAREAKPPQPRAAPKPPKTQAEPKPTRPPKPTSPPKPLQGDLF